MSNVSSRQEVLAAIADITTVTALTTTIELPPGALLVGGFYNVVTAATGTTPTLTMVDDNGTPNTLLSAVAIDAAAGTNAVFDEAGEQANYYPNGGTLSFTVGGTSPAGGRILVVVQYVVLGRQTQVYMA
jgi:hypothetical protein